MKFLISQHRITDINFLIGLMFFVLFFPQFQSKVGLFFEWLVTGVSYILCCLYLINKSKIRFPFTVFVVVTVLFLLILISVIRSFDILVFGDLFELFKPFYFCSFFLVSYNIDWTVEKLKCFVYYLFFFLFLSCLFGLFESLIPFGNDISMILYKDTREVLKGKAIFSFISPYTFGSILIFPIFYFYLKCLQEKKIKYVIILLLFLICLLLTQSRTSLLSFIFTYCLLFILTLIFKELPIRKTIIKSNLIILISLFIFLPFCLVFFENNLSYLYAGIEVLVRNLDDFDFEIFIYSSPSIYLRYEQLIYAIEHQDSIPIIGIAIGKAVLMPESFYAMYLFRTGLMGIFIHFTFLLYTIKSAYHLAKENIMEDIDLSVFYFSVLLYFLSFFFSYFSSSVNDQTRTGFIFYILIGLVCYCRKFSIR